MVSLAIHDPPRWRAISTKVHPGLPSRKVPGKGPVDDSRITFPGAVRLPLHGVDVALLDMVRLPGQLAVGGLSLLDQVLPLLPPGRERLQVRPDGRELRRQGRTESRLQGCEARRTSRIVRPWGRWEAIRGLWRRRHQRLMHWEVSRKLSGRQDGRGTLVDVRFTYGRGWGLVLGLRWPTPGRSAGRGRSGCGGLPLGLGMCTGHGTVPL